MTFVEAMNQMVADQIESFSGDVEFEYSFDADAHVLTCNAYNVVITVEADEVSDMWEVHAEVKDAKKGFVCSYFDSGDELDEIVNGRFENIVEKFLADKIFATYFPHIDEED